MSEPDFSDENIDRIARMLDGKETDSIGRCVHCGYQLQIGDYPFCPHGSVFRQAAQHFDPVLVFELPDGTHSYPGHNDPALAPEGAKPIFLDTLRKADEFVRNTNRREQEEIDIRVEAKRNHHDKAQRESRQQLMAELERRGIGRQNADAIIADRDGRGPGKEEVVRQFQEIGAQAERVAQERGQPFNRDNFTSEGIERMLRQTERRDPNYRSRPQSNFQIEVFAKDASNREGYRDERTGWKGRKG